MTVSYEWGPDDSAWTVLRDVFALPVQDLPRFARAARHFAGGNVLKWALVALGALGYALGVLVYWLFALFPLGSYLFLRLLTLPCFVAVYVVRGGWALVTRNRPSPAGALDAAVTTPTTTAGGAAPQPRRSTP